MAKKSGRTRTTSGPSVAEPFYVRSLRVENVRCFGREPQELSFCGEDGRLSQWTVLLGDNGTGKTTLLECVAALGLRPDQIMSVWTFLEPTRPIVRLGGDAEGRIDFEIEEGRPLTSRRADRNVSERFFHVSQGLVKSQRKALAFVCAYGAARKTNQASLLQAPPDIAVGTLFDSRSLLVNVEEWLLKLHYSASVKLHSNTPRFEQVRELLINVLPDDIDDIRVTSPTERNPQPRAEFKTPDGWMPLDWIGHGYQTLIAWIVDFASRMVDWYPRHKDPLKQAAVVLVDEIDLHMHPRWQRKLMTYLSERFPNTQFIVTAHSPIFVQAAGKANLVVLDRDREKGYVVINNRPEAIRGWRVDQLLTSDLFGLSSARGPEFEPLLAERKKLLSKPKLTKADKSKLAKLEEKIGLLPGGETAQDAKTIQLLDRTLDALEKQLEKQS